MILQCGEVIAVDKAQIKEWYGNGLTDAQLDGSGAESGSAYAARNYVALGVITQAQADEIRENTAQMAQSTHQKTGGKTK